MARRWSGRSIAPIFGRIVSRTLALLFPRLNARCGYCRGTVKFLQPFGNVGGRRLLFAHSRPRIRRHQAWTVELIGWGGRIRTSVWRNQNPLPYHLATPQPRPVRWHQRRTGNPTPAAPQGPSGRRQKEEAMRSRAISPCMISRQRIEYPRP